VYSSGITSHIHTRQGDDALHQDESCHTCNVSKTSLNGACDKTYPNTKHCSGIMSCRALLREWRALFREWRGLFGEILRHFLENIGLFSENVELHMPTMNVTRAMLRAMSLNNLCDMTPPSIVHDANELHTHTHTPTHTHTHTLSHTHTHIQSHLHSHSRISNYIRQYRK